MYLDSNGILYDLYALRTGVRPSGVHVVYCLPVNLPVLCERPHIPLALVLGSSNSLYMPFAVSTHLLEDMILYDYYLLPEGALRRCLRVRCPQALVHKELISSTVIPS